MKPSLCLNMIVKNEAARIERCLKSVIPYVNFVAILDTGSTDDTVRIIKQVCHEYAVPCFIERGEFYNFSQARNDAFTWAREATRGYATFALMVDADMELVVDDPTAFDNLDMEALSYDLMQKGGSVAYANRRLVSLSWGAAPYVGVTHEYIDVPTAGMIEGAWFKDYADGANRVNKFERDAKLLEEALVGEPNNGRYWYYLGNTYRDGNQPLLAADAYEKRIALGGWDEETYSAMGNLASAYLDAGHHTKYVEQMLKAYSFRPQRAEPLYELAKYYREKGDNAAALLFAKAGVNIKRPNDLLFVNEFVYSHGLRYECSIAGYYNEAERPRAFEITNALALDPTCPAEYRGSARANLFWHLKPLKAYCPSLASRRLFPKMPVGYTATNPSIEVFHGLIKCNVRGVNYTINEHGQYMIGDQHCGDHPIDTRNILCSLEPDNLSIIHQREILWHRPPPAWDKVTGLEDVRLWRHEDELNFSATVREQNAGGVCEMVRGRLAYDVDDQFMAVTDWRGISDTQTHEKNWAPLPTPAGQKPRFMYRLDTVIEDQHLATVTPSAICVSDISGSSQYIPFKSGYLSVVHEASIDPNTGKRTYWHRFAWLDSEMVLRRLSLPFVFYAQQIEFCAGLAAHPNNSDLLISFGVRDEEAHLAIVSIEEVSAMIWKFYE